MSSMPTPRRSAGQRSRGFTMVEMLVAMVLGIIVTGGIISLFISTSKANRVQASLAHMQENGRFMVSRLTDDLRMTNAGHCSNTGGVAGAATIAGASTAAGTPAQTIELQDGLRAPKILAKTFSLPQNTATVATASTAYTMPARFYVRGYDCVGSTCKPDLPASTTSIPAAGTAVGDRIINTDVLTLRYLHGNGWQIQASAATTKSYESCTSDNKLISVGIAPNASVGDPPLVSDDFATDHLAMLADCSASQVFAVARAGSVITPLGTAPANGNFIAPTCVAITSDARVFDFTRAFVTVSYYLQLVKDDNPDAPKRTDGTARVIGALMRKVDDQPAQQVVRGVERLDFRYGVEDATGRTMYLNADQVDTNGGGTLQCPPGLKDDSPSPRGCLWRAIKSIEVNALVDSINPMFGAPGGELAFLYPPDGGSVAAPPSSSSTQLANGLDRAMMRRAFSAIVSVRNYNP